MRYDGASRNNSTESALLAGQTFVGGGERTSHPQVMVACKASHAGRLYVEFSFDDGQNWDDARSFYVDAGQSVTHVFAVGKRMCRTRFVNGASNQTYFRLTTWFGQFGDVYDGHDPAHVHLCAGEVFSSSADDVDVADDGTLVAHITVPAGKKLCVKNISVWSNGSLSQYEFGTGLATSGTSAAIFNRNIGSSNVAGTTILINPTLSSTTVAKTVHFGGGGNTGQGAGGANDKYIELVLKASTTYLFRVRNLAGAAKALSLWLFWYEEAYS